jgi:hypothetical protein
LPEEKAIRIMQRLFIEGSVLWERFRDPANYLSFRKQVERKLRDDFLRKGGRTIENYPIYLVLGRPRWTQVSADPKTIASTDEIIVPLSILSAEDVSFTYPDSMVSAIITAERNPEYYEHDYHGRVFTLEEIKKIIEQKGLPGEEWQTKMPKHYAHYVEAQVWNRQVLVDYYSRSS